MAIVAKMVRCKNVIKAIIFSFVVVILCDFCLFPILFHNVVHSRYFSFPCKNENDTSCKAIDALFQTRNKNCETKSNKYWMAQSRKLSTKSSNYDDELKRYWSPGMLEFLHYNNQDTLDLLVMIITVRRRHGSYLQHNAKLLHQQIDKLNRKGEYEQKRRADIVVCNSDAQVHEHKEAEYLSDYIDVIPINKTKRSHKCCSPQNW